MNAFLPAHSRTLHLIERRTRLCRLAPAEIDHLLAHHRGHVELVPTTRRHVWQVTPTGIAGVLATPRRRIVIAPKLPLQNLLFLADPDVIHPTGPDTMSPDDGTALIDFLAGQLAARMRERAAAGLHRSYRQARTQGPYLVGSLDLAAQLRQGAARKDQLVSRHDDFTAELPHNQIPRRLAGLLLASNLIGAAVRSALEQALAGFSDISDGPLPAELLAELDAPEAPALYRPLIEVCRLLAWSLAPGAAAGPTAAPALLVSLERLFERHVTRGVADAFAGRDGVAVRVQPEHVIPGPPNVVVRPDVVIERSGQPVLVVDAKWKRLPREGLIHDDLYQVLAYCTILGARQAVLVYPGRRRCWDHTFAPAGVRVQVRTLDVAGPLPTCLEARRRLGRVLVRLIT
jgi:5-methylcytosine-specific restriction enzyme subunit McrC